MSYISENTNRNKPAASSSNGSTGNTGTTSTDAVSIQTIPVTITTPKTGQVMVYNGIEYATQDLDGGYF